MTIHHQDIRKKKGIVEENPSFWQGAPQTMIGGKIPVDQPVVVELFCGCGGTSLGFEMAGFHIAMGIDIHQPSIQTFRYNHPNSSTILGNIKKITPTMITDILQGRGIDVLIAGVPCQGFSLNNRKRNVQDQRNFLYKELVRLVEKLQPKCIVVENVSGMKSSGSFVEEIEKELSQAGKMIVKSDLLFAPDFGVPQKRRRLFFVGVKNHEFDFSSIKKTHGKGTKNKYVTVKEAIGDLPSLVKNESKSTYQKNPFSAYQKWARKNNPVLTNHLAPNHPQKTVLKIGNTPPGQPMYPRYQQRIRLDWNELSPTQVSGGIRPQFQLGHPSDARGLTIRERCRIQSFPDHFEVKGGIVQARVQTGNAVPPLMAKAIAKAIKKVL